MVKAVILVFERIGQEEYKTIPHIKEFSNDQYIDDIIKWIKSVDPEKNIADVYFTDKD